MTTPAISASRASRVSLADWLALAKPRITAMVVFTAFVGFNLLQSSFTRFCPLEIILRKVGVGGCCSAK